MRHLNKNSVSKTLTDNSVYEYKHILNLKFPSTAAVMLAMSSGIASFLCEHSNEIQLFFAQTDIWSETTERLCALRINKTIPELAELKSIKGEAISFSAAECDVLSLAIFDTMLPPWDIRITDSDNNYLLEINHDEKIKVMFKETQLFKETKDKFGEWCVN